MRPAARRKADTASEAAPQRARAQPSWYLRVVCGVGLQSEPIS